MIKEEFMLETKKILNRLASDTDKLKEIEHILGKLTNSYYNMGWNACMGAREVYSKEENND